MSITVPAARFKATCLDLLDQLVDRKVDEIVITKHGRVVGVLHPPPSTEAEVDAIFGCMRGQAIALTDFDLTESLVDESDLTAAQGLLHG